VALLKSTNLEELVHANILLGQKRMAYEQWSYKSANLTLGGERGTLKSREFEVTDASPPDRRVWQRGLLFG
jgi:hypothetical protein